MCSLTNHRSLDSNCIKLSEIKTLATAVKHNHREAYMPNTRDKALAKADEYHPGSPPSPFAIFCVRLSRRLWAPCLVLASRARRDAAERSERSRLKLGFEAGMESPARDASEVVESLFSA